MPYEYPGNIPRVAKNWSSSEQRKCTSAANSVLAKNGSEKEAIFACIHAAGKGKEKMKAMMKKEGDGEHPSGHYLVVEDPSKPTTWHLRVRGKDGKPDHTLMGAAWAALHGGYRGNKYQGPQKAQALAKLRKLYGSEGMKMPGEKTAAFFKDKDDTLWFVGVYSNNFIDKQKDIISEAAHKEYATWIAKTGVRPPIIMLHQPHYPDVIHFGLLLAVATNKMTADEYTQHLRDMYQKTAVAETVDVRVKNGFAFVIGKVFDHKRDVVEMLMQHQNTWGMSHGFIPLQTDDNIIKQYRTFEFTLAPEVFLANDLTAIGFKENKTLVEKLTEEEQAEVAAAFDDEGVEEVTKTLRDTLRTMLASKMMHEEDMPEKEDMHEDEEDEKDSKKEKSSKKMAGEEEEEDQDAYKTLADRLVKDLDLIKLSEVLQQIGTKIQEQDEALVKINTTLTALTRTEDEKIAEKLTVDWGKINFKGLEEKPTPEETEQVDQLKQEIPKTILEKTEGDPNNPLWTGLWSRVAR